MAQSSYLLQSMIETTEKRIYIMAASWQESFIFTIGGMGWPVIMGTELKAEWCISKSKQVMILKEVSILEYSQYLDWSHHLHYTFSSPVNSYLDVWCLFLL